MRIRKAVSADSEKLSQIAQAAKAYWKYPEKWLELWRDALTITPEFVLENEVYAMTENEEIIGFYAISSSGETAKLEHLWIKPENIGSGVGKKLFTHAVEKAAALGAKKVNLDSDPNAENFYLKMGAKRIGEIISDIEGEKRILPLMQIVL